MKVLQLLVFACFVLGLALGEQEVHPRLQSSPYLEAFTVWKAQFNRTYSGIEEAIRFDQWIKNAEMVSRHNIEADLGLFTYTLGLNDFADLSYEEFAATYLMDLTPIDDVHSNETLEETDDDDDGGSNAPATMDWRDYGLVTPVKNQGSCGSCWTFSATGALEGQHKKASGKLVSLSEQQLLDCCHSHCHGCGGGWPDRAFQYWINKQPKGAMTERAYPYKAVEQTCRADKNSIVAATMRDYKRVPKGNEQKMQETLGTVGPISIIIDAEESFHMYRSGVYYNSKCKSNRGNHAILAVGYNEDRRGSKYWVVKNSWGTYWGQAGYAWMARDRNNNCGIASEAKYPIV